MIRIGGKIFKIPITLCVAGVFPQIKENNYYNNGVYRIDSEASPTMKNCLMYKLCYYRFDEVSTA